ncbi:TlpA family protein disulfide reductase [Reichenbachiella carrageenanivorans]|uniref:TlpA family protein disulfide reductase n=1 Tax=Reichenbachiella carrageenanivorans TaxID=2979869 RepID=A0ABY6CZT8_9BACT|nr:TlpA disulfide reductase family protein [Reichenbachiella carrageenanivorans]UXX78318.1 TlpA family protein disulfide reductase [Reichenbachiella carrageenanivorans]
MLIKQEHSLIYAVLIACASWACSPTSVPDYVLISGTVTQSNSSYLTIKGDYFSTDIDRNSNGTFSDTLRVARGFYTFYCGSEKAQIFLDKGYVLHLSANQSQFNNTLFFSGKGTGTKVNNYLANKSRFENTLTSDQILYSYNETDFERQVKGWSDQVLKLLQVSEIVDIDFVSQEKRNITYTYLTHISHYEKYHQHATQDYNYTVSADFEKPLEQLDMSNEQDFENLSSYRNLLKSYIGSRIERGQTTATFESIKANTTQLIKTELILELVRKINIGQKNVEQIYQGILNLSPDSTTLAGLNDKMNKIRKLNQGMPSPPFAYKDITNQIISLTDLRGKYIYMDIWATWCHPCLKEIPALKTLQERYNDTLIEFVSLSIDANKDFSKWQDMVKNKELKGIQLFADQSWNSIFLKDYIIETIPRFILIDPNGNIINAHAPRPSNPETRSILDGLLHKS